MSFDLRAALLRKAETESARLDDFTYRERARTMRLLADGLGEDVASLVQAVASSDDAAILATLAPHHPGEIERAYAAARAQTRASLIAERGDPAPHPLA